MKTIKPHMSYVIVFAMALLFSVTSCQDEDLGFNSSDQSPQVSSAKANKSAPLMVDLQHFPDQLEDAGGNMPTDENTPLYNKNGRPPGGPLVPIMTPDGTHHVTLGEFNMITGTAKVKCVNAGTHVVMHLNGLIPNGVYTIWTVPFKFPGYDGTFVNRIGFGALGAIMGSANSNSFKANSQGNASISVIRAGGNLLTDGSVNPHPDYVIPNCLGDVYETHFALAYHLDNIASAPGARPTWVVQGFFQIWGSQLQ